MNKPRWTAEENRILKENWLRGVAAKVISYKLPGRSILACRSHAIHALELPLRRIKGGRGCKITLYITCEMKAAVGRRARERNQPETDYLRLLIMRDLGQ